MKKLSKYFSLTIIVLAFFSPTFAEVKKDSVVATINGDKILMGELNSAYIQNLRVVSNRPVTKKKVLIDIINRKLGIQKAQQNNLIKDPVVKQKINDILFHAQISKDLAPELKKITIKEQDIKNYYKKYPEYRTAHILLRIRVKKTKTEAQAALNQAIKISEALKKAPEKFSELANKYSQSISAQTGGDMGFQPATKLAPEYFKAIKGKRLGFISTPIRTQFGYHIIKVLAEKGYDKINKALYSKLTFDASRDRIIKKYFLSLRNKAKIEIANKSLQ
ncbi:peptidylprolyl isomerase [Bacteriovoracales bacterium]|nr:peptidylprolyl isomerase [Bacteriovoracales bacterium]